MSSPTPGEPRDERDESSAGSPSDSGSDAGSASSADSGSDATSASSAEESSDMTDAFSHEDEDSLEGSNPVDLGGACPLEPELPLLLYSGELETQEREKLEAHVRKCARCEGVFAELKAAASALDQAPLVAPRAEKWSKLKSNVLARAGSATPAAGEPAKAPPRGRPPKKPLGTRSSNASDALAAMVCGAYEEDLLFLADLEPARKAEVQAHLQGCARCREAQTAFATVGRGLAGLEVEWPPIDKWDSLKANVLAQVGIEHKSGERAPLPKKAAPAASVPPVVLEAQTSAARRFGGFLFRAAAVVGVFALGVYASDAVRGTGPDGIRRAYYEAGASPELAVAVQNYELVVREGTSRPELKKEVDDALVQLAALRRYNRAVAAAALAPATKRAELINVIAQFPATRAARFAVTDYTLDLENRKDEPQIKRVVQWQAPNGSGFTRPEDLLKGDHVTPVPSVVIVWDPAKCAEKLVDLQEKLPAGERREVDTVILAATLQKATDASKTDPAVAKVDLQKVVDKADPTSPLNLEARKTLEALTGANGS